MNFDHLTITCSCGGTMKKMMSTWKGIEVKGWRCKRCKEEVINPLDAQKALEIDKARKAKQLQVKVRRVGKSDVVTLPTVIKEVMHLKTGQMVEWNVKGGKVMLSF